MMRVSSFLGLAIVLFGTLMLLDSLGYLPFSWPVAGGALLALLGAWLLWARRGRTGLAIEAGARARLGLDGAEKAEVHIRRGAGRLIIRGGTEPGLLFHGTFSGGLECHSAKHGDRLAVDMSGSDSVRPQRGKASPTSEAAALDWNVSLTDAVPMSLDVEAGGSDGELDFSRLRLTDVRVRATGGPVALTLPANAGATDARLEGGAAALDVALPPGVAARVHIVGLGAIQVDGERFPRRGGTHQSPNYETAVNRVDVRVSSGRGPVTVH